MIFICNETLVGDSLVTFPFIQKVSESSSEQSFLFMKNWWVQKLMPSHYNIKPIGEMTLNDAKLNHKVYVLDIQDVFRKYCMTDHPTIGFFKLHGIDIPTTDWAILPDISFDNNAAPDKQYDVVISPYSVSGANNKTWPKEKWNELIKKLNGYSICVLGSAIDEQIYEGVDYVFGMGASEVCAIMNRAMCVITVDNGIGHMAHSINKGNHLFLYSSAVIKGWSNYPQSDFIYKKMNEIEVSEVLCRTKSIIQRHG